MAEHVYCSTFIAFVMMQLHPEIDGRKLLCLCLVHDLPEARVGDLNAVLKAYVQADEARAAADMAQGLAFGASIQALLAEYRAAATPEARLARDADHLALVLELKGLEDIGHRPPRDWLPHVLGRLQTATGKALAEAIMGHPPGCMVVARPHRPVKRPLDGTPPMRLRLGLGVDTQPAFF